MYTFGRFSTCDVVYQEREVHPGIDPSLLSTLSKVHFIIKRDETSKIVNLTDKSSNGTYINEVIVGREQTSTLEPNDQISLALPAKRSKIFMFL
jgi:pSer/pThr/pTyr-binding forkhead associated (FHA) protein